MGSVLQKLLPENIIVPLEVKLILRLDPNLRKMGKVSFVCIQPPKNGTVSRIRPALAPNSVVTTSKNDVDYVVTEYGITQLKGKSLAERTRNLIGLAHPKFREELLFEAKKMGLLN